MERLIFERRTLTRIGLFAFFGSGFAHIFGVKSKESQEGGVRGATNTTIPHMVAREYRNTASKFSQIPKLQLQMGKS